mgnify:CR=1 FL=1
MSIFLHISIQEVVSLTKSSRSLSLTMFTQSKPSLLSPFNSDNSSNLCKEKYPEIRFFHNDKNLAMAARNTGIDEAKGDFFVFLDADTVVEPNWLNILLKSYKKHGRGLYQGKLLKKSAPSILESCGDMTNIFGIGFARGRGQKDNNQFETFQKISFPVGACTFSSADTFREIGYVDESSLFFLIPEICIKSMGLID